ncbi:MAG: tRNA-dihydrouridine synthase [Deltaproteobacteria bacterium]|nr:MAG: tRNA-dihydrouridine synthase [Deltaproteobacteria bacterium]
MTEKKREKTPFLYLAPIRGLTDAAFREVFFQHFQGFDAAVAPFINPQKASRYQDRYLRDVLPEKNPGQGLVPQILNNRAADFLCLAQRLADLGYSHINWNLGCPAPMVAKKKRGSGLLPYPEAILALLDEILPKLTLQLSLKTRLGYFEASELQNLLPRLDDYPLKEIIIHARLGKDLYRGQTKPHIFAQCLELSRHRLVYNGDMNNLDIYTELNNSFVKVEGWMLGRGALANPFLGEEIKGYRPQSGQQRNARLRAFHSDLLKRYQGYLYGDSHILGRLKQLWRYLIASFPGDQNHLKKLLKTRRLNNYQDIVGHIFEQRQG